MSDPDTTVTKFGNGDRRPSPTHRFHCGTEVPTHAKYCPMCGSSV
ncbi:MAG TPA: zinc ribbon domain-containing protein [Acidobacteria bacterium]|nr:zinc ribbon domain-containing protein [Acidobacteriota bacterium]